MGEDVTSPKARGMRLMQLREATAQNGGKKFSRAAIERKYGLSKHTLQNWEEGKGHGLTENGARLVIDIYLKENIQCSYSWLMMGEGKKPFRRPIITPKAPANLQITNALDTVQEEVDLFKKLHLEGVVFEIKDDAMAPYFLPGDIVGGIRIYANDIHFHIGKDCIIETKNLTWLRRLQKSSTPGQYNLYALNPDTKIERPTIYSQEILTAAPVMRIWRGKKWQQ